MASGLILKSGSSLIGSPIIYQVDAGNITDCTFHRVNLTVSSYFTDSGGSSKLTFSTPAEASERLFFDISSALRATADSYIYTPDPPAHYPLLTYSLTACDEYMINGELHENVGMTETQGGKVAMGAFSDFERLLSDGSKFVQHFTRKPKTLPEIVRVGDVMVCPESFDTPHSEATLEVGPRSVEVAITAEGMQSVNGRQVFALPALPTDWYRFRFVNSLGCLESIAFSSLRSADVNITTDTYIRTVQETFSKFSRVFMTKKNDYETWHLATPPVDAAWQSWFAHEFMMARRTWIEIEGHWIPCHIIPSDTINILDRKQNLLQSITFSVRLDINGSPMLALTV